jgi:hypothetical protein
MTAQLLVRIPEKHAVRLRLSVPARKRSAFVADLLEKHLPSPDEVLHQARLLAEAHNASAPQLSQDFAVADMDGLDSHEEFDLAKLDALCQK